MFALDLSMASPTMVTAKTVYPRPLDASFCPVPRQAACAKRTPDTLMDCARIPDPARDAFYTTSQGSVMMPYTWFRALPRVDVDEPFAGDQLQRYGYLPNPKSRSNPEGLPIGFVIAGDTTTGDIGMTCAACHTAQ